MTRQVYFILLLVTTTIACSLPFSYADHSQTAYVKTTGATRDRNLRDSDKNSNKDIESIDADDEERWFERFSKLFRQIRPAFKTSGPKEEVSNVMVVEMMNILAKDPTVERVAIEIQKKPKLVERLVGAKDSGKRVAVYGVASASVLAAIFTVLLVYYKKYH
ncbi:hypothetical protein PsorP6_015531 [Peronosclerospora sorghi]|uniref:Uncharacterized protein n=1 Tax=Peronosclerospora sorghi TaxID=230839 RepID=A0ACC0WQF6_9STRA|nr:hypothetical protein PsorP6_015531 [Peronosclerospora sorghi]